MSVGALVRRVLGPLIFNVVGERYRAFFVDLDAVAESLPPLPPGATLLDIGGGDGALINRLVKKMPGLKVTMIDLSPSLGGALESSVRPSVEVLPGTSVREYAAMNRPAPDMVLVSDVIHHVPKAVREEFLKDVFDVAKANTVVVLKDVQPGSWRAHLAFLADRYISGDRNVEFIAHQDLETLAQSISGRPTGGASLIGGDPLNYCLVFPRVSRGDRVA